jgi:hypothetical protein
MTLQKSVEPTTVVEVTGLQEVDRLAGLIAFQAAFFSRTSQAVYRTRTRRTRWMIVRRRVYVLLDSIEKSIGGAPDVKAERR